MNALTRESVVEMVLENRVGLLPTSDLHWVDEVMRNKTHCTECDGRRAYINEYQFTPNEEFVFDWTSDTFNVWSLYCRRCGHYTIKVDGEAISGFDF